MNPYSKLLEQALSEIDTYSASYKGKEWPQDWYIRMKELIKKAASEKNQNRAEELIDMVSWSVSRFCELFDHFRLEIKTNRPVGI